MSTEQTIGGPDGFIVLGWHHYSGKPLPEGHFHLSADSGYNLIETSPKAARELRDALTTHLGDAPAQTPFLENARFEDVRKGDVVLLERVGRDRVTRFEGTAHHLDGGDWVTEGGAWLCGHDARQRGCTITILDRPTPQLPTGDGEMILSGNVFYLWDGPLGWKSLAGDGHVSHDDMAKRTWKLAKVVEA